MKDSAAANAAIEPAASKPPASYADLYGLAKFPFGDTSDSGGYILFGSHKRAFELLIDHLVNGSGVIVLQGEQGIGKTETLRAAAAMAKESGVQTIMASRPANERISLLTLIAALRDQPIAPETNPDEAIEHFVRPPRKVLLTDDTDLMPGDCVRLLLSLAQRASGDPGGPAIVLTRSADLTTEVTRPDLSQLFGLARNTIRLPPLGYAEIRQYIERSLWIAGSTTRRLIAPDAMKLVIARSGGVPGTTNRLMEAVLAAGFARGDPMITAKTITAAMGPVASRPRNPPGRAARDPSAATARAMQVAAGVLLVAGVSVFLYKGLNGETDRSQPVAQKPQAATVPPPVAVPATKPPAPARSAEALSPALMAALMKRGEESLDLGDIAAARLLFQRAAEAGNASAAVALGKTYDPAYAAPGQTSDPGRAADWYRKAIAQGNPDAGTLLKQLGIR